MRKTAVLKDPLFLEHDPGPGHVESPRRLAVLYEMLGQPELQRNFVFPPFAPAARELLELNHTAAHIDRVAATAGKSFEILDPDTMTSPRSYEAACLAAGAAVEGVRMVMAGEADNGFALVRPPGHHAEADATRGFCLFNNIAVGARFALAHLGLERILVVDWDLHHGNGTQNAFYDTDQVLYFSSHQYPYFPGSGSLAETGTGAGLGFTINVPLHGGQNDLAYARIFNDLLAPLAREYRPELILVSAGFDIYQADPLGTMGVTEQGFAYMTKVLVQLAEELCEGRLLLLLEGGYNLHGLQEGVLAALRELAGLDGLPAEAALELEQSEVPLTPLEQARSMAKKYWNL